jgi:hypothetical protein
MNMKNFSKYFAVLFLLIAAPTAVVYAQNPQWLVGLSTDGYNLIVLVAKFLVPLALLVFVWGIVVFIAKSGNEEAVEEGKRKMIWGVVALFVIVSIWGIVAVLQQITGIVQPATITRPSITTS